MPRMRTRRRRARWIVVGGVVALLALLAGVVASHRLPPGPSVLQRPLPDPHGSTTWRIEPTFAYDAVCFLQVLSGDAYFVDLFEGSDDVAYARASRTRLTQRERAAVDRLHGLLHRTLGGIPCAVLSSLLAITADGDLATFRAAIAHPRAFRREHADAFDAFYRRTIGAYRLPGLLVDLALRDLATFLDALDRLGFEERWRREVAPDLATLAASLAQGTAAFDVVPAVERLIGGGLPSDVVQVHLARYARPNGISLGATSLVMEERTDARHLVRVAAHEMLHGWVDWSGDAELAAWVAALGDDPVVARAFAARERRFGYNTLPTLAEEALTQTLDQLAAEALGVAEDPLERWFFADGGLHVVAPALYETLRQAPFDEAPIPIHTRVAGLVTGGALDAPGAHWVSTYARPCAFDAPPTVRTAHLAGDPALLALHPSYGASVQPGSLIVFLRDWCADDPQAAIDRLEAAALRWDVRVATAAGHAVERLPLSLVHAGNWSSERDGRTFLYRHGLVFRLPVGARAEDLRVPLAVTIEAPGAPAATVR